MKILHYCLIILLAMHMIMPTLAGHSPFAMPCSFKYLQKPQGTRYTANTKLIALSQTIRGLGLLIFYRITHKKKNLDQPIKLIHAQLKEFEKLLLQEEYDAMLAIKNKFGLNDQAWNNYLTDISELKSVYNTMLQQANATEHDHNIPAHIINIITTQLTNNSINPQSISIKIVDSMPESTLLFTATKISWEIDPTNNKLIIHKKFLPLAIEVSPSVMTFDNHQILTAFCAHEVEHIIQHHCLTYTILQRYISHYCAIDKKILAASPEFEKLAQIHEAQAELLAALKDANIALCLKDFRQKIYYPKYLYEEHYYQLSSIDMDWKIIQWLSWFQQFKITDAKNNFITKTQELAQSFTQLFKF